MSDRSRSPTRSRSRSNTPQKSNRSRSHSSSNSDNADNSMKDDASTRSSQSRSPTRSRSRSRSRDRNSPERKRSASPENLHPKRELDKDSLFSIMVNGLPDNCCEDDLRKNFEQFGEIGDCFVPKYRDSGRCRGFGFVRYVEKTDAEYAVDQNKKDPVMIAGREIRAELSKERPRPGVEGWRKEGKPVPSDPRNDRYRRRSRTRSRSRDRRYRRRSRSRSRSRSRDRYHRRSSHRSYRRRSHRSRTRSPPRRRRSRERTRSRSRSRDHHRRRR